MSAKIIQIAFEPVSYGENFDTRIWLLRDDGKIFVRWRCHEPFYEYKVSLHEELNNE